MTSGVPQGSVLAPVMFPVYMNYLPVDMKPENHSNMCVDEGKILRHIQNEESCRELQEDVDKLFRWNSVTTKFNTVL